MKCFKNGHIFQLNDNFFTLVGDVPNLQLALMIKVQMYLITLLVVDTIYISVHLCICQYNNLRFILVSSNNLGETII